MTLETHHGELMDEAAFSSEELANACGVTLTWVHEHVQAGVLHVEAGSVQWRFGSSDLVRARRIAQLEATYDADPQLAALTADLIEEVAQLRRRLQLSGS
ncbi:chaperone modulator CbpM [Caenimonas koreensis]|uniref:MerR family transcriptional regulator n=1 Tax=Caenimonas koreensis DSM 17982 TaxID=1121255 RepID=A0A844BAF6_9BURK|nr:chaperone modulator CbpM [Caenimonas koreensis]MRD48447.1 MerR family transcriptional regulator [Caenimonas koreensis DSM 17982]